MRKQHHYFGLILIFSVIALVAGTLVSTPHADLASAISMAVPPLALVGLNSDQLKELRATLFNNLETVLKKAEGEKRELTADEVADREEYLSQMRKLDDEITRVEEIEKRRAILAAGHINKETKKQEQREISTYSLTKAIREFLNGNLEGLEREIHEEAIREMAAAGGAVVGLGVSSKIPFTRGSEKRDVVAGSSVLVATEPRGFFDSLLAKSVLGPGGFNVPVWSDLVGLVPVPGITTASEVGVAATENATAGETTPTIAGNTLSPKRLTAFVDLSKQAIIQTSQGVEQAIKNDLMRVTRAKLEQQVIAGSASLGEMRGITNISGIGSVVGGTNGLAPAWTHMIALEKEVAIDNADLGSLGYLVDPKIRAKLKTVEKNSSGVIGNWVWDKDDYINGYKALTTTNVPSTLTKGTSTSICSAIIFGNFEDLVIGNWSGALDITVDPYSRSKDAIVVLVVNSYWDMVCRHPESFAAMLDAINI